MRSNLMTLPQLHRFGRTSLVRLQIRNYQLVVLFMIKICTFLFAMTVPAILSNLPVLSRIQHVFMNLSTYRWFYRFFGFSLSTLSQLYRSDRASLLIIIDQIQNICRFIYIRQSICSHVILFSSNLSARHFISIMLHLADDAFLYRFLWIRQISTIQSIASLNRLSSHTFGTVWCNTDMFHLKLLIRFSLLVNCRSN